jgi:LDH2 family malate/lactate/ureidoglycolate dehydrogenase
MQVINIGALAPLEAYQRGARAVLSAVKATPPADGFSEVLVPGEPEHRSRARRLAEGIELPAVTYREIAACAEKLGVPLGADMTDAADAGRDAG